ncbi:MAG: RidA family protein [Bacteroidetes bacterium]|nr:RidA family protein [Bacteroidota bacterium]
MNRQTIYTKNAPEPIGPYSQGVKARNFVYLSGQIAIDPSTGKMSEGNVEEQTKIAMNNVGALLKEAGLDYSSIVKTSIFIKNMDDFPKINAVYGSYFTADFPARETVEVSRLPKDALVEISVVAMLP